MPSITLVGLTIAAALTIAACGSAASETPASAAPSEPASAAPSEPATTGLTFTIEGFKLPAVSAPVGETVTWKNLDSVGHTVTLDDGSVNGTISAGSTFSHGFDTAGTFPYHCDIHKSMTGTITITQ